MGRGLSGVAAVWLLFAAAAAAEEPAIDFGRDVRPILADHCFACHGPDAAARKARLRLDVREEALAPRRRGAVIEPGRPAESTLVHRIDAAEPGDRMPPPEFGKDLSEAQRDILRRWIAEGAEYPGHWAFRSLDLLGDAEGVTPADRPKVGHEDAGTAPASVDAFLDARLREANLEPAPPADRATLLRRAAFDLTGLPPSLEELDTYLADSAPGADQRMVDRLLGSPHHAEHMARQWMDLARYADTSGYQYDRERTQWAWRDWVIDAFRRNMPYDEFSLEQIAGDLLPNASVDQIVATGFHRNHPITIEGGVVDEEYRVEYVMDRVKTVGATWLGLTLECARCHDHKYDPVSQREFYELYSFFDRVPERGLNGFDPQVEVMAHGARTELAQLDERIAALVGEHRVGNDELAAWEAELHAADGWEPLSGAEESDGSGAIAPDGWTALRVADEAPPVSLRAERITAGEPPVSARFVRVALHGPDRFLSLSEVEVYSDGVNVAQGAPARQSSTGYGGAPERAVDGNHSSVWTSNSITHTVQEADPWWEVDLGHAAPIASIDVYNRDEPCCVDRWNDFELLLLDAGRNVVWRQQTKQKGGAKASLRVGGPTPVELVQHHSTFLATAPVAMANEQRLRVDIQADAPSVEVSTDPRWLEWAALPAELRAVLARSPTERNLDQHEAFRAHAFERLPSRAEARRERDALRVRREEVAATGRTSVMVLRDRPGIRVTRVLERGQYDGGREEVQPGVPAVLPPMDPALPRDRLGLARWLVAPEHPLTARVMVNRLWAQCFGRGLVETVDNFGLRGAYPTHPALLDWLAATFVAEGWDVRAMLRRLVLSRAYRRSSNGAPDSLAERLLARAPRFRLDAECVRDQALAVSGLLDRTVGGPSVYPYQPGGLWQEINNRPGYSRAYPEPAMGQLHRRSLYTFWKRTLPPPTMQLFDAPNREVCTASRSRTNTPLQALALLHDPQFVEAARALAQRTLQDERSGDDDARLRTVFRRCTQREPTAAEHAELRGWLDEERVRFVTDSAAANALLAVGLAPRDERLAVAEHAAWTSVCRLLLNLSEVLTRR